MPLLPTPVPPTPPATTGTLPLAPPSPPSPAATLALLVADGLVPAGTRQVDILLSDHEFLLNGQAQPASLLAGYQRHFGLRAGGTATFSVRVR